MNQPFVIDVNVNIGVLSIEVQGFWRDQDADNYAVEIRKALEAFTRRGMTFVARVNVQNFGPQSPRTQQVQSTLLQECLHGGLQRVAYVMPDSLAKQQLARLNARAGTQSGFFNTYAEADSWLQQRNLKVS